MRQAIGLASAAAIAAALLTHAPVAGQTPAPEASFIAFRVDNSRVVATIKVTDTSTQQVTDGVSAEPIARFGYRYFDPPALLREQHAADMRAGDRWLIHSAPGQAFHAETERVVGGNAGCQDAIGVLLRVVPEQAEAFGALRARYFLAERSTTSSKVESSSTLGVAPSPSSAGFRRALESTLNALLVSELPRVRTETAGDVERMAASPVRYQRSWAHERQAVDEAMQRGRGKLRYDIQSFRLAPDGVLRHFVRAEWFVGQRQGFAASLWLRGEQPGEVFDTNLSPASWLRIFEFQGKVEREHLGLVLNVFDRDHDGWGEVLLARGGYESMGLSVLEYSPTGFQPTGIGFGYGC